MWIVLILAAAPLLLMAVLFFERRGALRFRVATKTVLSSMFLLVALLQPRAGGGYFLWMLSGLGCCLVGDICLALPGRRQFLAGLVSFLVGHVLYVFAFSLVASWSPWAGMVQIMAVIASVVVFLWLRPHLGTMLVPVMGYIVVISTMVCLALSVGANTGLSVASRFLVVSGSLSFYVSDILVARQRFVSETLVNRLIGLPLYYAGQFMLAYSVGLV